ncbi:MAG: pyridoxamine 5'-phosphate oxidase family protein [Acidimicrobiia bacterium]|nr:pyridoxamine 5'-phosphate oxidase family protein [Acidimicrobiia bacterium]
MTTTFDTLRDLLASEVGLATIATIRRNGQPLLSVVNVGVLAHPVTGNEVLGFVANGRSARLGHLRHRPHLTVSARRDWRWAAAEGAAELIGPDDPYPGFDPAGLPALLRAIFEAAGGTHDDWATFDRVMADERRCAVLLRPDRIYSNPGR